MDDKAYEQFVADVVRSMCFSDKARVFTDRHGSRDIPIPKPRSPTGELRGRPCFQPDESLARPPRTSDPWALLGHDTHPNRHGYNQALFADVVGEGGVSLVRQPRRR